MKQGKRKERKRDVTIGVKKNGRGHDFWRLGSTPGGDE